MILETERLLLRELKRDDIAGLKAILQDEEVMYAYAHAFDDDEVNTWYENQIKRYQADGIGLWAVIRKSDGCMIGQCGLTWQTTDRETVLEIGYLFKKVCWHQGYACEASKACKNYAFSTLQMERVVSIIRDNNTPSMQVALRNGMYPTYSFVKHYYDIDMLHIVYEVKKEELYEK